MHYEMGKDKDGRGLGMREERTLYGHTVDYLRKGNNSGVFSEATMPNPRVSMEYEFLIFYWAILVFWDRFQKLNHQESGKEVFVFILLYELNGTIIIPLVD